MPKLKITDDDLDVEALEEAEYDESKDFEPYDGPRPPKGTILGGYIKRIFWTYTTKKPERPMLKILFVAAENTGTRAQYNDWAQWDNVVIADNTKFRWKPFIDAFGLTLRDIKTKLYVAPEDQDDPKNGAPIIKIGTWKPGEEEDGAWARVLIKHEKYEGEWDAKVDRWLAYQDSDEAEDPEDDDEGDEEAEDETEELEDEASDEEEETAEEDEEEAEEEPAPTKARGRSTPARPAASARGGRKPAPAAAKPVATKPATRGGRAAASKPAVKPTATRGRGGRRAADDPPF